MEDNLYNEIKPPLPLIDISTIEEDTMSSPDGLPKHSVTQRLSRRPLVKNSSVDLTFDQILRSKVIS
jgi:hypothetical protein